MVSFDVKSLYTSIPLEFAKHSVAKAISEDATISERTSLSNESLSSLIEICLEASVFQYNSICYKQIKGCPMGSPVSVVIAELSMQQIEAEIFNSSPWPIYLWKRFVDDVIAIVPSNNVDNFLDHINSINADIQFTCEKEQNNQLAYLDMNIQKQDNGTLSFSIYRKPTHTDRYLDYYSYHPISQKKNVITALHDRASNLCSEVNKQNEREYVNKVLETNNYPKPIIRKATQQRNIAR